MSWEQRTRRAMVCDGCDYDIVDQSRVTTLEFTFSARDKQHGKIPLHFHETSDSHDCLRYWFTGAYVKERWIKRVVESGIFTDDDAEFILRSLRTTK